MLIIHPITLLTLKILRIFGRYLKVFYADNHVSINRNSFLFSFSNYLSLYIRSEQISRSVVPVSWRPHESQHTRPPCPSPSPGVHSDSRPSVMPSSHLILCCPLLLLPPIPPSIRVFSMSQLFT